MRSLADDLDRVFKSLGDPKLDIGVQERKTFNLRDQYMRSVTLLRACHSPEKIYE